MQLNRRKVPRPRKPPGHHRLNINIAARVVLRAPHLEEDEAARDGRVEANGALALLLLDEEARVRGEHGAAADGADGVLGRAGVGVPGLGEGDVVGVRNVCRGRGRRGGAGGRARRGLGVGVEVEVDAERG